jgi:hypothetical protein
VVWQGEICDIEGRCVDAAEDELFTLTTKEGKLTLEREKVTLDTSDFDAGLIFEQDPVQIIDALLPLYLNSTLLRSLQVTARSSHPTVLLKQMLLLGCSELQISGMEIDLTVWHVLVSKYLIPCSWESSTLFNHPQVRSANAPCSRDIAGSCVADRAAHAEDSLVAVRTGSVGVRAGGAHERHELCV